MNTPLNIALVQTDLIWEDPKTNRDHISEFIGELPKSVDLIVLPEMFTTGFSMQPKQLFETIDGESIRWMQSVASQKDAALVGSLIIKENERFYNRLVFVDPSGQITSYDKKHLFTLSGEHREYTAGTTPVLINFKGWKICPFICYDLRFPAWSRNTANYDVLIYVANWATPRIHAWNTLLQARAIENMAYCLGVNRVGEDANKHQYSGNSAAVNFLGHFMTEKVENKETVLLATLQKEPLLAARKKLGFLDDRDSFSIH